MGGVMAARLSEDSDVRVALVEADPGDNIHSPLGFAQLLRTKVDWDYSTAPEPFTDMQRIYLPRGKVLGGSSSINAMVYVRGNRADYDGWAEGGSPGWGYQDLLPYFELAEDNERGASEFHGAGAPLRVSESRSRNPISDAFLEAPKPGYPVMRTSTGKRTTASATTRSPSGMGAVAAPRWRTCTRPLSRPNLVVETSVQVHRVLFRGPARRRRPGQPLGRDLRTAGRARSCPMWRRLQLPSAAHALGRRPGG